MKNNNIFWDVIVFLFLIIFSIFIMIDEQKIMITGLLDILLFSFFILCLTSKLYNKKNRTSSKSTSKELLCLKCPNCGEYIPTKGSLLIGLGWAFGTKFSENKCKNCESEYGVNFWFSFFKSISFVVILFLSLTYSEMICDELFFIDGIDRNQNWRSASFYTVILFFIILLSLFTLSCVIIHRFKWYSKKEENKQNGFLHNNLFKQLFSIKYPCCGRDMGLISSVFFGFGIFYEMKYFDPDKLYYTHKCEHCKKVYQISFWFSLFKLIAFFFAIYGGFKIETIMQNRALMIGVNSYILSNTNIVALLSFLLIYLLLSILIHMFKWYADVWNEDEEKESEYY